MTAAATPGRDKRPALAGPSPEWAVEFAGVSINYEPGAAPVLRGVDLAIPPGELVLVVGTTGSGKSTLLRAVNGLVPHFSGGTLAGHVRVCGRDTRDYPPRELADVVGLVSQDPRAAFVTEVVEDELAYGMECLGVDPATMRRRVEETLDLLGLTQLRARPLARLSGGQRQRVAIGAALTSHPQVLVLDEPTSALDPGAAEEVLAALQRLVHDLGMTVLLAEHRLERVVQYADTIVVVEHGQVRAGPPGQIMIDAPVAPPVVELGRLAGWSPLPLSIRDARRASRRLRDRLGEVKQQPSTDRSKTPTGNPAGPAIATRGLVAGYGRASVLRGIDLDIPPGQTVALMGRNGAGKSTLLNVLVGALPVRAGTVRVSGASEPAKLRGRELIRRIGLVPAEPADLLYAESVAAECRDADSAAGVSAGTAAGILAQLAPGVAPAQHPRDLSEGQRLALALSVVLAPNPSVLLLDEPTRGLDYSAKRRLVEFLKARRGLTVLMATHDVELAAEAADRVVVLADGQVVSDGPTAPVVTESPLFAPQVAKVLHPGPWLTVEEVAVALAAAG